MPGVNLYAKGFHLNEGMIIQGYRLVELNINHKQIVRNRKYEYPSNMTWKIDSISHNRATFESELRSLVSNDRTINSEYGNPYYCSFGNLIFMDQQDGSVYVSSSGTCNRI